MPKRSLNSSTIVLAVGAAKMAAQLVVGVVWRGGCFHAKSIITPTKLVTVTPESRHVVDPAAGAELRPAARSAAAGDSAG